MDIAQMKDQMVRTHMVETNPEELIHTWVDSWGMGREELTDIALSLSLCPVHFIDYAICFDDQPLECEVVREVHPTHDT